MCGHAEERKQLRGSTEVVVHLVATFSGSKVQSQIPWCWWRWRRILSVNHVCHGLGVDALAGVEVPDGLADFASRATNRAVQLAGKDECRRS